MSALKYETPMFQEFPVYLITLYFLYGLCNALFCKFNSFFSKALLDSSVSCHSYAKV